MGLLLLPESKDARNGLVNCYLYTERYQQALALLNELLEQDPHDSFSHRARASVLQQMGQEKNAAIALETLKRMNKLKASDFIVLGDIYHNLALFDKSFSIYQEALRQKQKLGLEQYIRVARILIGRGSFEEGFSYLDQIESFFGSGYSEEDEKKIRLLQAEVMRATGKDQSAQKILEEIVRVHPLEGAALLMLGQIAWKQKEYAKASLRFERSAKDSDHEVRALIEHARMMVSQNQYEKASTLLERAQTIDPQPQVAKYLQSINSLLASSRIRF
jgi:tetratricopeptide (TPR) repeat protein